MRRFLLLAHRVPVNGAFTLNDLAGGAGRMDEVARSVSTAFTLSNDLRRDTEMTILFVAEPSPQARKIRISGARVRFLNPDERSTAALLKNALVRSLVAPHDVEASPGLVVGPTEALSDLASFARAPDAIWLTEAGVGLDSVTLPAGGFSAVLSDPTDPTPEEEAVLRSSGAVRISLGPRSLRASQCIDSLHNAFDRAELPSSPPPRGGRDLAGA